MALLDGLNEELQNELLDNEKDFRMAMEADFDAALEAATEKQLSDEDIAAILGGDDDLPSEELDVDDPDDPSDDVDIPTKVKPATEAEDIDVLLESLLDPDSIDDDEDEDEECDDDDCATESQLIAMCDAALDACGASGCGSKKADDVKADEAETELDGDIDKVLDVPEFDDDGKTGPAQEEEEPEGEEDDLDGVSFEALLEQCLNNA